MKNKFIKFIKFNLFIKTNCRSVILFYANCKICYFITDFVNKKKKKIIQVLININYDSGK